MVKRVEKEGPVIVEGERVVGEMPRFRTKRIGWLLIRKHPFWTNPLVTSELLAELRKRDSGQERNR